MVSKDPKSARLKSLSTISHIEQSLRHPGISALNKFRNKANQHRLFDSSLIQERAMKVVHLLSLLVLDLKKIKNSKYLRSSAIREDSAMS